MNWENFLKKVRTLPIIDTKGFYPGIDDPASIEVQITRWMKDGKIIQLKRGLYLLSEAYRKIEVFEPYLAYMLKNPSYISLEKAFEYYNLIPESVSVYTSVTTQRPGRFKSEIGIFDYRHIQESLFWGYKSVKVNNQTGFMASPEKAFLDFFYLRKGALSINFISEMRLQNLDKIDMKVLLNYAQRINKPRLIKFAELLKEYIKLNLNEQKTL
jgi:predicted transcriptional regulator of viral defense system